MYPVPGASGGAICKPLPRIPAKFVAGEPCHKRTLKSHIYELGELLNIWLYDLLPTSLNWVSFLTPKMSITSREYGVQVSS